MSHGGVENGLVYYAVFKVLFESEELFLSELDSVEDEIVLTKVLIT